MSDSTSTNTHARLTDLDGTIGALLIGTLLSMTLYGVTCSQTYDYFLINTDGVLQKSIIALLWTIDTFSSASNCHIVYHYLVTNFTNPSALLTSTWSMNTRSLTAGISNFIIRSMFARQIYQFSKKNKIATTWIMVISICDLAVSIATTAVAFEGVPAIPLQRITRLLYASFALSVVADLSVAIALCWLFHFAKTGFRRSDSLLNTLMTYVVNTGFLVSINATVGMITYIVMPHNLVFYAFFMLAAKLYVNAYLASLNARGRLRDKISNSSMHFSQLGASHSRPKTQDVVLTPDDKGYTVSSRSLTQAVYSTQSNLAISLETTVERMVDNDSHRECVATTYVHSPEVNFS